MAGKQRKRGSNNKRAKRPTNTVGLPDITPTRHEAEANAATHCIPVYGTYQSRGTGGGIKVGGPDTGAD